MECDFILRHYRGERPNRILTEVCSLTGRPCFLEPTTNYRNCLRREWALSYQSKHPAPDLPADTLRTT